MEQMTHGATEQLKEGFHNIRVNLSKTWKAWINQP